VAQLFSTDCEFYLFERGWAKIAMMLVDGVFMLSARGGDLLGSKIYNISPTNGFLYCVIATTLVYALILPLILLVPKELIATAEGEPNPTVAAEVLEEIAETGRPRGSTCS
jgi:hypothetical protein